MDTHAARNHPTVDWHAAGRWAARLVPTGPTPSREEAALAVAEMRQAAHRARDLAVAASGLSSALDAPGAVREPAEVLVIDRAGWARAAAGSFAGISADDDVPGSTPQAAAVLAMLGTRVLGQFDPYGPAGPGGRLLMVAPNILRMERLLRVPTTDFRLWVAVHEQTHALQFAAAPWLAAHMRTEVAALLREVAATPAASEAGAVLTGVARALRGGDRSWSVLDVLPPSQRERVERLTAVMALLEGHADVTMDGVGRRAIPSVRRLRKRMEARRQHATGADLLLRRLLGLDAKLAQYRDGAAFVRAVRRAGGPDALDVVWTGPSALPSPREISDAPAWLRRMGVDAG